MDQPAAVRGWGTSGEGPVNSTAAEEALGGGGSVSAAGTSAALFAGRIRIGTSISGCKDAAREID